MHGAELFLQQAKLLSAQDSCLQAHALSESMSVMPLYSVHAQQELPALDRTLAWAGSLKLMIYPTAD